MTVRFIGVWVLGVGCWVLVVGFMMLVGGDGDNYL